MVRAIKVVEWIRVRTSHIKKGLAEVCSYDAENVPSRLAGGLEFAAGQPVALGTSGLDVNGKCGILCGSVMEFWSSERMRP